MKIYELIRRNSSYAEVRVSVFNKMAELPISESTASVLVELELAVNANPSGNWRANETRAQILVSWAKWLPDELKIEALEAIRQVSDDEKRAEMLTKLVTVMPADLKIDAGYEALAAVKETSSVSGKRPIMLAALTQALPETMKSEALSLARSFEGRERAQCLSTLANLWPEPQKSGILKEALAAAYAEQDSWMYIETLCELAAVLPEESKVRAVGDARVVVQGGYFDLIRAEFLCKLAAVVPEDLNAEIVDEALTEALKLSDDQQRIPLLIRLATVAPTISRSKIVSQALVNAATRQENDRVEFLHSLASSWTEIKIPPPADYHDAWSRALRLLASHKRSSFLLDPGLWQKIIQREVALTRQQTS